MTQIDSLIRELYDHGVEFIVIGGVAGNVHGSVRVTFDLDIVYKRAAVNLDRLTAALAPMDPYLRGAPAGLPFQLDRETLKRGLNFTLDSTAGPIDLLGEVAGGGSYEELLPHSDSYDLFGIPTKVVKLRKLIQLKRAAGRGKDLLDAAELEALLGSQEQGADTSL